MSRKKVLVWLVVAGIILEVVVCATSFVAKGAIEKISAGAIAALVLSLGVRVGSVSQPRATQASAKSREKRRRVRR